MFRQMTKEKESWLTKLIELLNEYETPQSWIVFKSYDDYDWTFYWVDCDGETEIAWSDSYICSKKFWFIKWLVENEKIDLDNEDLISLMSELWERRNPVKCLLMLLSIQDEPIRFLCEMLK